MTDVTNEWEAAIEAGLDAGTAGARAYPNWKVSDMILEARTAALATHAAQIEALRAERDALRNLVQRAQIVGSNDLPDNWHRDARAALGGPTDGR